MFVNDELRRSSYGHFRVLTSIYLAGLKKTTKKKLSGWPVSGPQIETGTFWMWTRGNNDL